MEKWCGHLQNKGEGLKLWQDGSGHGCHTLGQSHTVYFQFCPICGTPRPKRQTLAEVLKEHFHKFGHEQSMWSSLADAARKFIREEE